MYQATETRYQSMPYHKCGNSGLKLPAVSFGLWHNFGDNASYETMRQLCFTAFDNGITHFDLANNYGPEPGSAEKNFGRILKKEMKAHRDEMIISTKAGYLMWDGPYGDFGSRKYMLASLDQSLKRMGLEYVDIFSITVWILRRRLKSRWERLTPLLRVEKLCMREYLITMGRR